MGGGQVSATMESSIAMLSRTLKMAFWVLYDHLGKLMAVNLVWSLTVLIPGLLGISALMSGVPGAALVLGVPLLILAVGIVLPIMSAGLAHMVKVLIDTRDGAISDFFEGIRLYWRRALALGVLYILAGACLAVSIWFYAAKLGDSVPWLGYGLSALALWGLAFTGLTALLVFPALVQKKGGIGATLKLTAALVADNPVFCLGLAFQCVGFGVFLLFPPVLVFLGGAWMLVLVSSAYEMLARKYARAAARDAEAATATGGIRPMTRTAAFADEAEDDYLNRGFRDFLFPWKG